MLSKLEPIITILWSGTITCNEDIESAIRSTLVSGEHMTFSKWGLVDAHTVTENYEFEVREDGDAWAYICSLSKMGSVRLDKIKQYASTFGLKEVTN